MSKVTKILICIPCLTGAHHVKEAIESVINKTDVDVFILDNGADEDVKKVIDEFEWNDSVFVWRESKNIFVNPAWNQFLRVFLTNEKYSHMVLMNSDLIMQKDFDIVLRNRWNVDENEVIIPQMIQDKNAMQSDVDTNVSGAQKVYEGTAGVFITLNRKQAEIVHPLPTECLVWFGDEFAFTILRALNYDTVIPENLLSYHYWSQTVQRVAGISEIIERDKLAWEATGRARMIEVINKHK